MTESKRIKVEVAFGKSVDEQIALEVTVHEGATVEEAIQRSGILKRYPDDIDFNVNKIAIFGKKTTMDAVLSEWDRIEICRPLLTDPKEARKRKAERDKAKAETVTAEA